MINQADVREAIRTILKTDVEFRAYCLDKLGSYMIGQKNAIGIRDLNQGLPKLIITTSDDQKNYKRTDTPPLGWKANVTFVADFTLPNDKVPTDTKEIIDTDDINWTPKDIMEKIAELAREAIYQNIGCELPGVSLDNTMIIGEEYYANDFRDGIISSVLLIDLYKSTIGE